MYTLLTGATGLVGRYLVRDLLLHGHKLAVVVRPSKKSSAQERVELVCQYWEGELGRMLPRPVVLSGNISEDGFALSGADRQWVAEHVDCIIHNAAILEFHGKDRNSEPWRTNLGGTQNMIKLCRELEIYDIHYVSTAYVAGRQAEPAMEDSLDVGQTFRNDYEESKFLAEKEVRAIDFAEHVTVYRPAVISGDSVTGYTNTYHGIYLYLRLMAMLVPTQPLGDDGFRNTPLRLSMTGKEFRNLVPVEWVSSVMVRIFENKDARGGTYHLAPDKRITSGEMIGWCGEYFKFTGVEYRGYDFAPEGTSGYATDPKWEFERMVRPNMGTYQPYERDDNVFDLTNMKRLAGDIVCPEIDRKILHRYLDFAVDDRWGKKRQAKLSNSTWAEESLSAARVNQSGTGQDTQTVGIDAVGPGGGQFTITYSMDGVEEIVTGLPDDANIPVLHLTVNELSPEQLAKHCEAMRQQAAENSA
jgi:thioester reductase-like protein